MDTKQKVLYELLTKNAVSKQALLAISENPFNVYKALSYLKRKDCIREISFEKKIKNTRRVQTIDYVVLTTAGLKFAKKKLAPFYPWVSLIEDVEKVYLQPSYMSVERIVTYFLKVSTPAVMISSVPHSRPSFVFTDNYSEDAEDGMEEKEADDGKKTIGSLVRSALSRACTEGVDWDEAENGMTFVPTSDVKAVCMESPEMSSQDVRAGKYSGVIISEKGIALVYVTVKSDVLIWYDGSRSKEFHAFKAFQYAKTDHAKWNDPAMGVLLVDGVEAFKKTFLTKPKGSEEGFGSRYDFFWVIPINYRGCRELDEIFNGDIEKEQYLLERELISSGEYVRNVGFMSHMFPLVDSVTDTYTALITHLDACRVKQIITASFNVTNSGNECAVLCRDWQVPYLESVLPVDVEVRVLDSED